MGLGLCSVFSFPMALLYLRILRMPSEPPNWRYVVDTVRSLRLSVRVKWSGQEDCTPWQPWIIIPAQGYLETGSLGPVPFREVEWVEVSPTIVNYRGRLVPDEHKDLAETLTDAFKVGKIPYQVIEGHYRIEGSFHIAS